MGPLHEALKGKPKHAVDWTECRVKDFNATKAALANATMLAHPSPTAPIAITSDASDYAVGAVYEQWVDGAWQPLAFFSRQLRLCEQKYSTFDRELLGIYLAIRHFCSLLEGRHFTAFVDHKPLTFAMAKVAEPWSARQQRHLSYISEFTTDLQHIAGKSNHMADWLDWRGSPSWFGLQPHGRDSDHRPRRVTSENLDYRAAGQGRGFWQCRHNAPV